MQYVTIGLIAVNTLLFLGILGQSLHFRRNEESHRTKRLWTIVALVSIALVIGSIQRFLVQASLVGWMQRSIADSLLRDWQFLQSLGIGVLALTAFATIRRLAGSFAAAERVAGPILDRVAHVEIDQLELSPREWEVMAMIGKGLLTDSELTEALHISASTVQTHIKSILRKTNLSTRKDLIAVAHLIETHG